MKNGDFENQKRYSVVMVAEAGQSHLVDGELVAKVVENVVGGCGKAAGGCENKVGSHEEIGVVCWGDVACEGLVAAGGAGVG